jgi:hypothetical protein
MTDSPVYPQQGLSDADTPFNALMFTIKRALSSVNVATLVQVQEVYGAGIGPVGTVDVLPLVNQVDGANQATPHTTIYGVPYFRYQGGTNAVIVDPSVGDFGFCIFADRDFGSVQAGIEGGNAAMLAVPGAGAPPSSVRRFDYADGIYLGGWNGASTLAPISYVQVVDGTINVVNPTQVNLQVGGSSAVLTSGIFTVNANLKVNGTSEVTGNATFDAQAEVKGLLLADANFYVSGSMGGSGGSGAISVSAPISSSKSITATNFSNGSIDFNGHYHSGVQSGGSNTSNPSGG